MSEDDYKPDLELLDRYQQFSSELLRLSLLGMALLGFFFEKIANATYFSTSSRRLLLTLAAATALSCLVAAAGALAHRYLSTDGVFYHIRSLRHSNTKPVASHPSSSPSDHSGLSRNHNDNYRSINIAKDEGARNARYHKSGRCLGLSAGAMATAALCAAITIAAASLSYIPENSPQGASERVRQG